MTDKELKKLEGRWFLQYSGCPMWKKTNIDTISFNYELKHMGEELVLKEQLEFRRNGRMRVKSGYEILSDDSETLTWKGKGMDKYFRTNSKVLYNEDSLLIMWFGTTRNCGESIDVLTRKKFLNAQESKYIFSVLQKPETSPFLGDLESVNIL